MRRTRALIQGLLIAGSTLVALPQAQNPTSEPAVALRPLPIPPLLTPTTTKGGVAQFDLSAQAGLTAFFPDHGTPTYGYNGMGYLGPTLRLKRGQPTRIKLRNRLPGNVPPPAPMNMRGKAMAGQMTMAGTPNGTSLHLHGLEVSSSADITPIGGCITLPPGASIDSAIFTPDQPAATLWYHPHPHMDTGRQVYWGLAGLMILEDPAALAPALPHTYGLDDLPLIVQDRRFKADRSFDFRSLPQDEEGMLGDRVLVNGAITPYANVPATRIRLRLLNASNSRNYLFALGDGRVFQQIASDGGLLSAPATLSQVMVPPASRVEIVVDLSHESGRTLDLVSRAFDVPKAPPGEYGEVNPSSAQNATTVYPDGIALTIMQFRIGTYRASPPVPARFADLPVLDTRRVTVTRRFDLELGADNTINGLLFSMDRVDQAIKPGAWEIWTVVNYSPNLSHSFHVHGIQFRVLDRSTGPRVPNDQGWKDTVRVEPSETVRLLMHFEKQSGRYMFHCHNLEHEDMGMMGVYEVGP